MPLLTIRDRFGRDRPPRIALVIDRLDGRRGGAESYTRDLARWLAAAGCEVHVVARRIGAVEQALPLSFHRVGPGSEPATVADRLAALAPDVSHDMGAAVGCDVFQPHAGSPLACLEAADMAWPVGIRHLRRMVQSYPRRRRVRGLADLQFGGGSALFIAVSQRVADDITARHGVPPARIRVVHNGVDVERFHPVRHRAAGAEVRRRLGVSPDEVLVLTVAHNHRLKGVPVLARALRRLRRQGLPVRGLVCGGPRGAWRASDRCPLIRLGAVTAPEACYGAADIAAQPTFYDACSLTTLEALASGLPVVTTSANGTSELITSGRDGIVLDDPADDRALAVALAELVTDRGLRAALGAAGARLAARHTAEHSFLGVVAVYAEVVAARGGTLLTGFTAHVAAAA